MHYGQHALQVEELARSAPVVAQANALTVLQVCKLERMIKSTPSVCDRVLLGGVLALLYSRGRASDGDRTVQVIWDVVDESLMDRIDGPPGFIELASVGKQGCEDVEVAPTVVATHHSYGQRFRGTLVRFLGEESKREMGVEGDLDFPLLPCFTTEGKPTMRNMCATEIGKLLRGFLSVEHLPRNVVRSHSLKATILSWMAKCGSPLFLRRLAGHHLNSTS